MRLVSDLFIYFVCRLDDKQSELLLIREVLEEKEKQIKSLECENQIIRDEYQALNLMHNALDEKYLKCEVSKFFRKNIPQMVIEALAAITDVTSVPTP